MLLETSIGSFRLFSPCGAASAPSGLPATPLVEHASTGYFPLAFAALTLAQRAFVAAMMLARPAGWMVRNQSHTEMTHRRVGLRSWKTTGPPGPGGFHRHLPHLIVEAQTVEGFKFTESEHLGSRQRLRRIVLEVEHAVRGIDRHPHPLQGQHLLEGITQEAVGNPAVLLRLGHWMHVGVRIHPIPVA